MADISVTASAVIAGANAVIEAGVAGATITAGQAVYKDATTGRYGLADADHATAGVRDAIGISLNGASDGQPLKIIKEGDLTINAVLTANTVYILSGAAGGIAPLADLSSGEYLAVLGAASSTTVLKVKINKTGVAS